MTLRGDAGAGGDPEGIIVEAPEGVANQRAGRRSRRRRPARRRVDARAETENGGRISGRSGLH